jgi:hypothetical protein
MPDNKPVKKLEEMTMTRHNSKKFFTSLVLLALLVGLGGGQAVWAESNLAVGGSATARLDFRVTIPTILYLQVGTVGAVVDVVSCTLANIPGTGAVAMTSSGTSPVPVRVAALVPAGAAVRLLANSSTALNFGGGLTPIPFDQISWVATGAFTSGTFNNNAAQVLNTFAGSGNRTGTYAFSYANANYYGTGIYTGRVTYTLSSP